MNDYGIEMLLATGAIGATVTASAIAAAFVRRFLYVCKPNELLVFSGRRRRTLDGREAGFRVLTGGRALRIPLLEKVDRMDMTLISVPMSVSGAYSEGGIPLAVGAIANVKVSSEPGLVGNAVERFLGKSSAEIARVAKETLEGHLRGVLATMTPEEVNEDRLKFADRLGDEAGPDLAKLGLQLDTLKIQHVSDDRGYLDSIGRSRIAEILRTAEVAESDAVRGAEQAEAAASARAEIAKSRANATVQQRHNEARRFVAELNAAARAEEERTEQASAAARAEAEQALHKLRAELESLRLAADVGVPAEIARRVETLLAEGSAAQTAVRGEALAEALEHVRQAWLASGEHAMDMVVAQNLETIFERATTAAVRLQAKQVSLLDAGDGKTVVGYAAAYPAAVKSLLDQLSGVFGVSFASVLRGGGGEEGTRAGDAPRRDGAFRPPLLERAAPAE